MGYLKWAITKWTTGEDTEVDADKASYLVVYPTKLDMKDKSLDESIQWFAAEECSTSDKTGMKSTSLEKSALKMFNLVELTQNIQVKHVTIKEDG